MEAKHTPGPWRVSADGVDVGSEDSFNPFGGCGCCGSPWLTADDPEVAKADARLIAAAPELLEACQTFAEWLRREEAGFPAETRFNTPEGEAKWREWFEENIRVCALAQEQARAAIAKATQ